MIRMKVDGDYYNEFAYELDVGHTSHYVDSTTLQSLLYATVFFVLTFFLMICLRMQVLLRHYFQCLATE